MYISVIGNMGETFIAFWIEFYKTFMKINAIFLIDQISKAYIKKILMNVGIRNYKLSTYVMS